jgi:hypothetical protein
MSFSYCIMIVCQQSGPGLGDLAADLVVGPAEDAQRVGPGDDAAARSA